MKIIKLWYSIRNHGDGSAYPHWFGSATTANKDQDLQSEGWGESCTGSIQSFEGSDEHKSAIENDAQQAKRLSLKKGMTVEVNGELVTVTDVDADSINYNGASGISWADFENVKLLDDIS
jgi:hypothetical protein